MLSLVVHLHIVKTQLLQDTGNVSREEGGVKRAEDDPSFNEALEVRRLAAYPIISYGNFCVSINFFAGTGALGTAEIGSSF